MRNSENFWDGTAKKYARSPIKNQQAYSQTMERCKAHLSMNDNVLEIGCGTGSTALLLADSVGRMTASDISGNMIQIARAKDPGAEKVTFVKGTAFDDTFKSGSFSAVVTFNLLHLLKDIPATVRRANELLEPGGLFISKTTCLAGQGVFWPIILPPMQMIGFAPYVKFMTPDELENIITGAGFKVVETGDYPASPPSRFIVARKI